ncbi:MAG: SDR family NAD(P)-dependent oxidoreductase [Promicromonosporaceae bacterium]|nr:SDR family NAD(P)-dependent oxidoreductase [Promicromonosporaceae bacterium]
MTHRQHPLGTGFTPASTTDDVLKDVDLTGRNVVVTGGHSGLGRQTTLALAGAGAHVTVASRNPDRAREQFHDVDPATAARIETRRLDLLDPGSIDAFVEQHLAEGHALHTLINNAGLMGGPLVRDTRGYESQFATNHLGHFQLTLGLLPALRAAHGARVVNLTSGGHRLSDIRWDDPHFHEGYDPAGMLGYGQSKTANVLFAVELDRRWAPDRIRGFAVHPGIILGTNLGPWHPEGEAGQQLSDEQHHTMGLLDDAGRPIIDPYHERKTLQQGASTTVFAATSPLLDGIGGVYLKDNDISVLDEDPQPIDFATEQDPQATVVPYAIDPVSARRLWALSEELLGRVPSDG